MNIVDQCFDVPRSPAVCVVNSFISLATTANPLPATPARAASIAALSASNSEQYFKGNPKLRTRFSFHNTHNS
jgi:hypothetical protein